jgi:hypothetical protein
MSRSYWSSLIYSSWIHFTGWLWPRGVEFAAWLQTAQGTRVQSRLIGLKDML